MQIEIKASGGAANDVPIHIRRHDEVAILAQLAVKTFCRLDVFVANANAMPIGPVNALALVTERRW